MTSKLRLRNHNHLLATAIALAVAAVFAFPALALGQGDPNDEAMCLAGQLTDSESDPPDAEETPVCAALVTARDEAQEDVGGVVADAMCTLAAV